MRYCHECGAQVAPEDAFCAFCGITLEPIPVAPLRAETDDAEQEFTADASQTFQGLQPANQTFQPLSVAGSEPEARRQQTSPSEPIHEEPPAVYDEQETIFGRVDLASNSSAASTPAIESKSDDDFDAVFNAPQNAAASSAIIDPAENPLSTSQQFTSTSQTDETELDDAQMATLPNYIPQHFAAEADMPVEEIREAEEPATVFGGAAPQAAQETDDRDVSAKIIERAFPVPPVTETGADDLNFPPKGSIERSSIPTAVEPDEQATLFSAPIPQITVDKASPRPPEQQQHSAPRATEAQQAKDTPSGKSNRLKTLDDGTVLNNRYEIIRRIGGGGMGAVYLARDKNLGGTFRAVKEMIQAYIDESQQEKAVQDFRRESLMLTALEHPAIPTIYDYFYDEEAGRFYLVMKYISGGDLAGRLRAAPDGKIDERSVTEWAIQVADVLDYLHNRQPPIVYRDLKPSNVMLDGNNGRVMLVDFGIARAVNREEKGVTAVGTMGYAPPELFAGNAEPRSDIYSLGATMFHLLTGADPQNNPLLIFDFTKNPRPRQINPQLSMEMEDILLRAVEYNASLRFKSAAEMRDRLFEHQERIRAGRLTYSKPEEFASDEPQTVQTQASAMVFCGFCGERIAVNDMFCAYCGSKQPEADRVQAAAKAAFPSGRLTAKLVLETSALDSPAFVLEKDNNLVGREDRRSNIFPEIDLTRFDVQSKISRRHARIWRQGATFMVEDLGSANGTTLLTANNKSMKLLAHQPHVLSHGDRLRLGETTLHFLVN